MNVSNKQDNAVLRYSKLKSASATLARRNSLSEPQQQNIARLVTSGRITRVHLSVGFRRKRQTVVDVFSKYLSVPRYRPRQTFVGMWFRLVQRSCLLSTEVISRINIAHCLPPCQGPVVAAM